MVSSASGFIRPNCLRYWKSRKEAYVGYLDGVINVYSLKVNADKIVFSSSFRMHTDAIHNIFIMEDLNFAASSGFDSSLKLWQPPKEWETKVIMTSSMIDGIDPNDNLSTIKEENESVDHEALIQKHRITAWGAGTGDKVVESLLQQF